MNKKFIGFIVFLAVAMFVVQYRMPRRFTWQETHAHYDRQPFGCYVFDSVLATSMPNGYSVTSKTLWQLEKDSTRRRNYLVMLSQTDEGKSDIVMRMAQRGDRVMVLGDTYGSRLTDTLGASFYYCSRFTLTGFVETRHQKCVVKWVDHDGGYRNAPAAFAVHPDLLTRGLEMGDSLPYRPMALFSDTTNRYHYLLAASFPMGKGEVILVSAPLLFTNYAVLNPSCQPLLTRLLDSVKDKPLVRLDPQAPDATYSNQESPLYVLLQRPPLRWAIYLALVTVMLYIGFTARRRQRVIPVVEPPKNNNMEFVRLIGTLYYQQGRPQDLLQKKLTYANEKIRRLTGIDLTADDDAPERLAALTGMDSEQIYHTLASVRQAIAQTRRPAEKELLRLFDQIDRLTKEL